MPARARILLADDHVLLLEAFRRMLEPAFEVVDAVVDGAALVERALALEPELVVADVSMPRMNGLEAARRLRGELPRTRVVFLTVNEDPQLASEAFALGASGYLLKSSTATELNEAIRAVLAGRRYLSRRLAGGDPGRAEAALRRADDEADRRRARHRGAHGRVPQVPDDGDARDAQLGGARELRDREPAHVSEWLRRACALPPDTIGLYLGIGFALLFQSLAVALLLLERRRRQAAEDRLHQLSGRLITAQEEERGRIARDLHDDAGQRLALLAIELDQRQAPELADQARALSGDLHRIAHQLHPASLDQLGLLPAVRRLAAELSLGHGVAIEVAADAWPEDVPRETALVLYRVMQEALQNAVRHSGAARIDVALRRGRDGITLRVTDFGRGFVPETLGEQRGLGLAGMSERLRLVSGSFRIDSRPGGGTILEAWLPLRHAGATGASGVPDPIASS
jgi:signal transduction histidine kinase